MMRKDITTEEKEFEKQKNECTFRPKIKSFSKQKNADLPQFDSLTSICPSNDV